MDPVEQDLVEVLNTLNNGECRKYKFRDEDTKATYEICKNEGKFSIFSIVENTKEKLELKRGLTAEEVIEYFRLKR